jgi:hypothetical protein
MQPAAQAAGNREEDDKAPKGRMKMQPDEPGPPDWKPKA